MTLAPVFAVSQITGVLWLTMTLCPSIATLSCSQLHNALGSVSGLTLCGGRGAFSCLQELFAGVMKWYHTMHISTLRRVEFLSLVYAHYIVTLHHCEGEEKLI